MSYKTILVHVTESRHLDPRVEAAANIALAEDAHLIGVAITGAATHLYELAALNPADPGIAPYLEILRQQAEDALKRFENIAQGIGVNSFEARLIENETALGVSLQARHCDLTVLGQIDPNESSAVIDTDFPEFVIMNSGCPGLVIPYINSAATVGHNALIAWNASVEAARTVHHAIPLLQRAKTVGIVIFNPESEPEDVYGVPPGIDIKHYLARHNIRADIITKSIDGDIGHALLSLATHLTSDLLVMGCYGHSRFREILLGGVTRTILRSATIPVLMSH
jgi:nucleotide-binding universal stress UspA family protein